MVWWSSLWMESKKTKKKWHQKKKKEFEACLRGDDEDEIDKQIRLATQESLRSQHEWEDRQWFKQQTRGLDS